MNQLKMYFISIGFNALNEPHTVFRQVEESDCLYHPTNDKVTIAIDNIYYTVTQWNSILNRDHVVQKSTKGVNHYLVVGDVNLAEFLMVAKRIYIAINHKKISEHKLAIKELKQSTIDIENSNIFADIKKALQHSITIAPDEVLAWSTRGSLLVP